MRWYDRLMIGALIVACATLAVMFGGLGRHVAELDDRRTPVTIEVTTEVTTEVTRPCPVTFTDQWHPAIEECP